MDSTRLKLRAAFILPLLLACLGGGVNSSPTAQVQVQGQVCGDPTATCPTSFPFAPHDLPFVIKGEVEFREYESGYFYAVILKSVKAEKGDGGCDFVPEAERLEAQRLLPKNKVFASRAGCAEQQISYDGVNAAYNILAVYGGGTKTAAEKVLRRVKARYPDANVRRMRVLRGIT
jgi:hypothetical protein